MESIPARLNAVQEKILDLYEADSNDLNAQIEHWKLTRMECVLFYKAKELGITHIGHQVVPPMAVSKAKACQAIELQLALEALNKTQYSTDGWTLQQTSLEMWRAEPQKYFKKHGYTITVQYDNDKNNTMDYTNWKEIYLLGECECTIVEGQVDYYGLYYWCDGEKTYFVKFSNDAKQYSVTGVWEVHVGGQVIVCPASVSSNEVSTTETAVHLCTETSKTSALSVGAKDTHLQPPQKRRRPDVTDSRNTKYPNNPLRGQQSVDSTTRGLVTATECTNKGRVAHTTCTAPIIHLKGDPNSLKCLRYRVKTHKSLYVQISSTWHWTSNECTNNKLGIVTITYSDEAQRQQFLKTVKIPNTVQVIQGVMSL
uniref:Regulatory protein E2 n=1 Tax=Human papillomavirus 52 TaxID=10618 RepID=F8S543_HPV52|nr:early protein E2 [human papillomavirus 52]